MILKTFSAAWVEGVFSCGLGVRRCAPPAGGVSDAGSVYGVPGGACDVPAGQRGGWAVACRWRAEAAFAGA